MKIRAIVPCAGIGVRLGGEVPKPFVLLGGRPIFVRTLEVLQEIPSIEDIILVVHGPYLDDYRKAVKSFALNKVRDVIAGGKTRGESVKKGLELMDRDTDLVLIHDGVRPLVSVRLIKRLLTAAVKNKAVISAVPVKPTIKEVNVKSMRVEHTLERSRLWEVQTPQVFNAAVIREAYRRDPGGTATDDAALVEDMGVPVKVITGDYDNIKITTPEDVLFAEALLNRGKG
jgi:2-C-methyl-D-erythritol 4-phosphate cytidylyltransferase